MSEGRDKVRLFAPTTEGVLVTSLPFIISSVRLAVLCEECEGIFVTEEVTDHLGVFLRDVLCEFCRETERDAWYYYADLTADWEMERSMGV